MVIMNVKKNGIVLLTFVAGCFLAIYVFGLMFNKLDNLSTQPVAKVEKNVVQQKDYFEEYRLNRERLQSKQVEVLQEIVNNPNSASDTRREAQKKLLFIADKLEKEAQTENVLIAKGYKDAIVLLQPDNANVIIKCDSLMQQDTEKVKELVSQLTGISNEEIVVITKN